ncbi:hypothetical protein B566_EDAN013591 [Ephemera danica]|nr:hypothetical protein B566_EDAN013591 [Ephemera danica]
MDSSLAKSLETFKKRAISQPTVEKKKREAPSDSHNRDGKRPKLPTAAAAVSAPKIEINRQTNLTSAPKSNSYKSMGGSSQYKFGVLARIVKHMRKRHQVGDDHPLTLDDILDETNQLDVGSKVKQWLGTEALVNNPKIEITSDGSRYVFKAPYKLRDKKSLLKLLKHHDLKGMGGILLEDVQESLPHCEKALKVPILI